MANCENLATCPFFNDRMDGNSAISKMYKKNYCLGDKTKCARYQVFDSLGKGSVPKDLFPNAHDKAAELIAGGC